MKKDNQHIRTNKTIEKLILEQSSNYVVPKGKGKDSVWCNLSAKINIKSKKSVKKRNGSHIIYKVAASVTILILSSIAYLYSDSTISTKYAETKELYLPDGSSVFLQSNSNISFNTKQWNTERKVELNGEAFFSVKKGKTFSVQTKNGNIQVLGTQFNVTSRKNTFKVACVSGKVSVQSKYQPEPKILTKGMITYKLESGKLSKPLPTDTERIIKRQSGIFYFEQADITQVFEEIERQFDVKIKYTEVENRKFTGYFSNKNIEKALKMVCNPMKLDYKTSNKLIIIEDLNKSH